MQDPETYAGGALRTWRTARGMSQQQVADALARRGCDSWRQTTVARTEAARRPLRLNELIALAAVLEVGVDKLLEPWYQDMSLSEARERLHALSATILRLGGQLADARARVAELGEEIGRIA
jgi:transcriptional regulator with XRE-family HTH domain